MGEVCSGSQNAGLLFSPALEPWSFQHGHHDLYGPLPYEVVIVTGVLLHPEYMALHCSNVVVALLV